MDKVDLNAANEKLMQIQETQVASATALPFELLNRRNNKTTKLIANSGETESMNGVNRWFDYEFSEPVFLCEVIISMENYRTFDTFEVKWELAQGGEVSQDISRESDTVFRANINELVRSVSFKPPKKWFTDTKLNSVSLTGFQKEELEEVVRLVARLDRFKADIIADSERAITSAENANVKLEALRQEQSELNSKIAESEKNVTDLNNQIGRLTEERNGLLADVKEREESIAALAGREAEANEYITERKTERSALVFPA
ncbi:MAG: hypothetical protein FH759_14325 [Sediminimonas qiaohouensis]|uniref:Uncharacterized protein n=1 Tax=Sediminimonas qiaohouensis TaxID=552061 RepID=A0A7C9HC65_9RHOB|nr:hypothetical protein [Sediminimonas qiaohouensis]MTJ05849.1 hypothetical protein [Sediminimonas qiaohouensis]